MLANTNNTSNILESLVDMLRSEASPSAMRKLRIVTSGVSGGTSLKSPFRDARRFKVLSWFKDHFLSPRAKPKCYGSYYDRRLRGTGQRPC
jgi:hypothetical protein